MSIKIPLNLILHFVKKGDEKYLKNHRTFGNFSLIKDLTYKRDKQGNLIYDDFNIDPHTLSAIWYALDLVTVADIKEIKTNSRKGVVV